MFGLTKQKEQATYWAREDYRKKGWWWEFSTLFETFYIDMYIRYPSGDLK
jgi:hypothetical protein